MSEINTNGSFSFNETFKKIVQNAINQGNTVMLVGPPGVGKSSFVMNTVNGTLGKVFWLGCNQLAAKEDLTGCRSKLNEETGEWTQVFFPHQSISDAINYAKENPDEYAVLFFDEVNRTTSDVTSAVLSLITEKKIGTIDIPENVRFIIAGNETGNVSSLDQASRTRYSMFRICPDTKSFLSLDLDLYPSIRTVLTKNKNLLLCDEQIGKPVCGYDEDGEDGPDFESFMDESNVLDQATNPRTIENASKMLKGFDDDFLEELINTEAVDIYGNDSNMLKNVLIGVCGDTQFTVELCQQIAIDLDARRSSGVTSSNTNTKVTAQKPKCWSALKDAETVDEIREIIGNQSDDVLRKIILYALSDPEDNSIILKQFNGNDALTVDKATTDTLMSLLAQGDVNQDNISAFIETGCNYANSLSTLLEAYGNMM